MEESEIVDQSFSLIFAFDEIVALGYRESVNLAQIRTFTEMDSHEEKVFQAVRQVTFLANLHFYYWAKQLHKGAAVWSIKLIPIYHFEFLKGGSLGISDDLIKF